GPLGRRSERGKYRASHYAPPMQPEPNRGPQDADPVDHASAKVDRGRFRKIFGRTGNFANSEASINGLRQHLIIEHEILGAKPYGKAFEDSPAPSAIACMVL